ncbi:MAG: zinc-dependent metalloprotease [Phycisphaerales bacterium]
MKTTMRAGGVLVAAAALMLAAGTTGTALAQQGGPEAKAPEYPPFDAVTKDLTKVVSTADGSAPLYELYKDDESGRLLAVLPANYEGQLLMIACTIAGGDPEAGVMGPTYYVKWSKIGKQLALVEPNLEIRTDGDAEAKRSVEELYTGRVILATPIVSMAPGNRPVIDLGSIATAQSARFFGETIFAGYGPSLAAINPGLAKLTKTKAFPQNVIVEYQAPSAPSGRLVTLAYSIGELKGTPGFKPRKADSRVGYFYDWKRDFAKGANQDITDRYISRWNLEKADPKLRVSPPKQPIVWYIEDTVPVAYRRYVREGIEMWNQAYEGIGIVGALEVRQQDAATGAFMDIDPEDARYNFFRWNTSDQSYAIGPSRTNPLTGEILDADVVWHQGLTRSIRGMIENLSDDLSEQAFSPETLAWLDEHPKWDPRLRMASPEKQAQEMARRQVRLEEAADKTLGERDHPWTRMASDQTNAACRMGSMLAVDFTVAGMAFDAGMLDAGADSKDDSVEMLDGLPEEYIGQMIRYISAHEVGHCLGLQHNMAASSIRTLAQLNSPGFEGPSYGSVMDYAAVNLNANHELGPVQGPYATREIGPYDKWAIAYGYGPEDKLDEVLSQVSEPDHIFVSQIAMSVGSDPRNMTWDMGADNLQFAESRINLANELRGKLLDDIVKDGEPWAVARRRYSALLSTRLQSMVIASNWIGGSYINNDYKGDPGDRTPIDDVPAEKQRRALKLIVDNSFDEAAFGLTPELLRHMGKEYWWDPQGINELMADPSVTVHDTIGGIQAFALTMVMNPTTLRRVYDNEYRAEGSDDVFTLAELVSSVSDAAWREVAGAKKGSYDAGKPMISSFRRNLQREHTDRLIDLALLDTSSPALRTISTLAKSELRRIDSMCERAQGMGPDAYTSAHLADVRESISRALDAAYVIER